MYLALYLLGSVCASGRPTVTSEHGRILQNVFEDFLNSIKPIAGAVSKGVCNLAQQAGCDVGAQVAVEFIKELGDNAQTGGDLCVMAAQEGCTAVNEVLGQPQPGAPGVASPPVETPTTPGPPPTPKEESNKSKKMVLVVIIVLVLLATGIFVWYQFSGSRK